MAKHAEGRRSRVVGHNLRAAAGTAVGPRVLVELFVFRLLLPHIVWCSLFRFDRFRLLQLLFVEFAGAVFTFPALGPCIKFERRTAGRAFIGDDIGPR